MSTGWGDSRDMSLKLPYKLDNGMMIAQSYDGWYYYSQGAAKSKNGPYKTEEEAKTEALNRVPKSTTGRGRRRGSAKKTNKGPTRVQPPRERKSKQYGPSVEDRNAKYLRDLKNGSGGRRTHKNRLSRRR